MNNGYERFVRPLLFLLDPETAHHLTVGALRVASDVDLALRALRKFQPPDNPKRVFDLDFPNPVGLAAGLDKNGAALPAWAAMGFGFVEIGTVTARPQPGNPAPRIFRYPEQNALINRLGFNNDGADAVARRLDQLKKRGHWPERCRIGINIGKSKATPLAEAVQDYLYSFRALHEFADYIVLNVSSPNTPGLRELQSPDALSALLAAIANENAAGKPTVVKIAPDLSSAELEATLAVCESSAVAGVIATNTTLDHSSIPSAQDQQGGLSGAPLREKSTEFVRQIAGRSAIPVIASGGIMDRNSAREKIAAGAQLVQIYTGFIYRGPGLLREIADAIA